MVIKWQEQANKDIQDYYTYSKTSHPKEYMLDLMDYISLLSTNPNLGKDYITIYNYKIKLLIYKMHKIFYYIRNNAIYILKIAHTHMNEDTILRNLEDLLK